MHVPTPITPPPAMMASNSNESESDGDNGSDSNYTPKNPGKRPRKSQRKRGRNKRMRRIEKWRPKDKEKVIKVLDDMKADDFFNDSGPSQHFSELLGKSINMNATHLKNFMKHCCRKVKEHRSATHVPLDKWIEITDALSPETDDLEQQIGHVMMVAMEEPIDGVDKESPDASMPFPNYGKIYKYISCALANKTLPILSPIDCLAFEDCMQTLTHQIKCLSDEEVRKSLRKVYLHLTRKRTQEQEEDYLEIRKKILHNASIFNPLGINAQAIVPAESE